MRLIPSLLRLVVAGWLLSSCTGKCSGTYNCPEAGANAVFSPGDLASPLVDVVSAPPCTASLTSRADAGAPVVTVSGGSSSQAITCLLHGTLADGTKVQATVQFTPNNDCCGTFTAVESAFTPAGM